MKKTERFIEDLIVFLSGGLIYSLIEICYRGFTHWSMTLTGGACLLFMYRHYAAHPDEGMLGKCVYGCAVITTFELLVGCVVNLLLGWNVWDYSSQPLNLFGQICVMFSAFWFLLSVPAAALCEAFRMRFLRNAQPEQTAVTQPLS